MKNEFFSRAVHRPARESNTALDLARDCTCLNAFALTHTSARRQFLTFFSNFWFLWKEKKIRFPYSRTQIHFSFYKLKDESSLQMCVKFYFSRVCRMHKNFRLFIEFLLKTSFFANFFCFFGLLKIGDICLPAMKFLLNCH